jgi:hypothetical protein
VTGLDAELYRELVHPFPSPSQLVASEGVLWVVTKTVGECSSLVRLELETGVRSEFSCAAVLALAATSGGGVAWLESAAPSVHLWCADASARRRLLGAFPEAQALAAGSGEFLVGVHAELLLLRDDGTCREIRALAGPALALAPSAGGDGWWCLAGGEWLSRLDSALDVLWRVDVGPGARRFAVVPSGERVWVVTDRGLRSFGERGVFEQELELPAGGWEAWAAEEDAVWLTSAGAVLEVDTRLDRARLGRSQGGFARVSGLIHRVP